MNSRRPTTSLAWLDLVLLTALLGGLNVLAAPGDPGWLELNPSPWLLLPVFMGGRYGFKFGLLTGLAVAAGIVAARVTWAGQSWPQLSGHPVFLLGFPAAGFVCGELHGLLARRLLERTEEAQRLAAANAQLEAGLRIAEDARFQLQERLALHGAEAAGLDAQLRALFEPGAPPLYEGVLHLLQRIAGVTQAAIYEVHDTSLLRASLIGTEDELPPTLGLLHTEMARLAISNGTLTTCRELWQSAPGRNAPFMAALPWRTANGAITALVLIRRMAFLSVNWNTFALIETACLWAAHLHAWKARARATPAEEWSVHGADTALQRAVQTHRLHGLPSAVVTIEFITPALPHAAASLMNALKPALRATDLAFVDSRRNPEAVCVLVLMEGQRGAADFIARAREELGRWPDLREAVTMSSSATSTGEPAMVEPATPPAREPLATGRTAAV